MRRPEALFAFALAVIVGACKRDAPAPPPPSPPPVENATAPVANAGAASDARHERPDASALGEEAWDTQLRMMGVEHEHIARVKTIGHTSVVLRIEMREGRKYAFKPRSKRGRDRYQGEIAAFRLGLLLGIGDSLPKAYPHAFPYAHLTAGAAAAGDEATTTLLADEVVVDAKMQMVRGALMPWIDGYEVLPLEKEPLFTQWRGWLKKDAPIPDDKKELAAAASTLVLFDYLTGNWDRWSGGNVATANGKILFVDNDGAFFESPPADALARNKRYLEGVDRFSKSFVEKLRTVTDEEIERRIGGDGEGALLSRKALGGVFARRKEALAIIEKKELYFP